MALPKEYRIKEQEVTNHALYLRRREFIVGSMVFAVSAFTHNAAKGEQTKPDQLTPKRAVTSYNNFYEFGTDKRSPAKLAKDFKTEPWFVAVEGHCAKPGKYPLEDLVLSQQIEERIYRLRCVEAWSMVIPWKGFELGPLLKSFEPTADAKFVRFETLYDPVQMPGQKRKVLQWPYVEGLTIQEAMHPLTFIATGLYGEDLPNQNGAPLRLVVPWKYGFKSIKSIVRISFEKEMPRTSWNLSAPHEYGFYANVNPNVDHPRWSQATERRIGERGRRDTLMFNGYEQAVAGLYTDLDLTKWY